MQLYPQSALNYNEDTNELEITAPVKIGDIESGNYIQIEDNGSVVFNNESGLVFGEIYAHDANDTLTISGSGKANKVQVTTFDTDGLSNNVTPDQANSHITIDKSGIYLCVISISAESGSGVGFEAGFSAWKNNGTDEFENIHAHRNLSGGGGDTGSISMSGIIDLVAGDTVEIWTWNETNTVNVIVDDITLSLVQIGG
jgi:hypothetical protein